MDWNKYNYDQIKIIKKIINTTKISSINYIHKSKYNHVRDVFSIAISLINYKPVILDFGGSLLSYFDLNSKISKNVKYILYNPHLVDEIRNLNEVNNIEILTHINTLAIKKKKVNILYSNSVVQYLQELESIFLKKILTPNIKLIILTDVYVSYDKDFYIMQKNHNIKIKVRNINKIIKIFEKYRYNIIFKSVFKKEKVSKKYFKFKSYYLCNMIFKR